MRKLLVVLVLLLVVAFVADTLARRVAEGAVATELANAYELNGTPSVAISGWPFLLHLAGGEIDEVQVDSEDVRLDTLRARDLALVLRNVRFDIGAAVRGDVRAIRVGGGTGALTVTDDALTRAVRATGAPVDVTLDGGEVVISSEAGTTSGSVHLDDGQLIVSAGGDLSTAVELPTFGGRIVYESLSVGQGAAILRLRVLRGKLKVR